MAEPKSPATDAPVRTRLAEAASEDYELIRETLREGLAMTKKVWTTCPRCNSRHEVEIPDSASAVRAAQLWLNQGFGARREQPDEGAGQPMVFQRIIIVPGEKLQPEFEGDADA